MKQLTCEMCGSTNLLKKEGIFICQSCGTKYSVEEAKKMMVEGTVEVQGTVKVDNSDKLKNLYQIAHRAKEEDNSENAAKYFDLILQEDPNSWEASFYVVYYKAMQTSIDNIPVAAKQVSNSVNTVLKLIKDTIPEGSEQEKAVEEVAERVMNITTMLYSAAKNWYDDIDYQIKSDYIQDWIEDAYGCISAMYNLGEELERIFGTKYATDLAVAAWKLGVTWHLKEMYRFYNAEDGDIITSAILKIKQYDKFYIEPSCVPSHSPSPSPSLSNSPSFSPCYIATAVYGSCDCSQVWILRRYRDFTLSGSVYGRFFIRIYYIVSPTIVKWFGGTKWFNLILRGIIDRKVEDLRERGIENTPYDDSQWKKS